MRLSMVISPLPGPDASVSVADQMRKAWPASPSAGNSATSTAAPGVALRTMFWLPACVGKLRPSGAATRTLSRASLPSKTLMAVRLNVAVASGSSSITVQLSATVSPSAVVGAMPLIGLRAMTSSSLSSTHVATTVPHPVSWTHVCATRHGVARIARALRVACDTPASRGASTGCSVRRTRRRPRVPRRGFERPGRRRLAP